MSRNLEGLVFARQSSESLVQWRMLAKAALLLMCLLWMLLCLRFYRMIARENVVQRRVIAISAGLGAGLLYIVGSLMLTFLRESYEEESPILEHAGEVKVRGVTNDE